MSLPAGQFLEFMRRRSLGPAKQSIDLGCFRAFPKRNPTLLFPFLLLAWLGRVKKPPDSLLRYFPAGELLDRYDARQIVPDRNQPFQRPRARPPFPFFDAPDERCVFCFCLFLGQGRKEKSVFGEMKWHSAALFLA